MKHKHIQQTKYVKLKKGRTLHLIQKLVHIGQVVFDALIQENLPPTPTPSNIQPAESFNRVHLKYFYFKMCMCAAHQVDLPDWDLNVCNITTKE